jgi:anionic cell wall polymer biosynthesis LytR-Cps2A-Psr (LCP) family protein
MLDLPPNTLNVALLGVDTRPRGGGANTDVIVIASINPDAPAVTLLSIPRDTLVYIPGWRWHKVNVAYAKGGAELFKRTIAHNFGIRIDSFAMVNFAGLVNAVDTLDGIDVVVTCPIWHIFPRDPYYVGDETTPYTVTRPYVDTFTGETWEPGTAVPTLTVYLPQPGVYTLDGLHALAFARAREGVPGGDIDRGRREQQVIRAILAKGVQVGAIPKLPELFAQFQRDVKTDLPLDKLLYLGGLAADFDAGVIRSRYLDGGGLDATTLAEVGYVLIPNRASMPQYLEQALTVALNQRPNEGIPIQVVNATGIEGFGEAAAARLAELGFRVVGLETAEEYAPATRIVNYETTAKGSGIPLLQKTFKIPDDRILAQPGQGETGPDAPRYRILVGDDFVPCYRGYRYAPPPAGPALVPPTPTPTPDPEQTPPVESGQEPAADPVPVETPQPEPTPTPDPAQPTPGAAPGG